MSTVHSFQDSLRRSEAQVDAEWWEAVYRKAFPTMKAMVSISEDGWAQRGGVDRAAKIHCGIAALLSESEIISNECRHRLQSILPEQEEERNTADSDRQPLDLN